MFAYLASNYVQQHMVCNYIDFTFMFYFIYQTISLLTQTNMFDQARDSTNWLFAFEHDYDKTVYEFKKIDRYASFHDPTY